MRIFWRIILWMNVVTGTMHLVAMYPHLREVPASAAAFVLSVCTALLAHYMLRD